MDYKEYRKVLKELKITIKDFSLMINTSYGTVAKWGKDGRAVPSWVETWLNLYIENQECKKYKESMQTLISGVNNPQTPQ